MSNAIIAQANRIVSGFYSISYLTAENARRESGLTLEEAAECLNLTPRALKKIERTHSASMANARHLARLYGCPGNLFTFSPERIKQPQRIADKSAIRVLTLSHWAEGNE